MRSNGEATLSSNVVKKILNQSIQGALFVDAHTAFVNQKNRNALFHECDGHLSPNGAELLATLIGEALQ